MAQAPFFTGRDYENGHFSAETSVESKTPSLFGSFVDSYGTGFYLRPESGIKVFRNRNTPTTGLICGASVSREENLFMSLGPPANAMFLASRRILIPIEYIWLVWPFFRPMRESELLGD